MLQKEAKDLNTIRQTVCNYNPSKHWGHWVLMHRVMISPQLRRPMLTVPARLLQTIVREHRGESLRANIRVNSHFSSSRGGRPDFSDSDSSFIFIIYIWMLLYNCSGFFCCCAPQTAGSSSLSRPHTTRAHLSNNTDSVYLYCLIRS